MKPYYADDSATLYLADMRLVVPQLPQAIAKRLAQDVLPIVGAP